MVIGRERFPRAHETLEGNIQDRKTLVLVLDLLEKRVGLPQGTTVVVNRGVASPENIAELRRRKLHFLVAASQKERDIYLAEFEAGDEFKEVIRQPSPRNPSQKKSSVQVKAHAANNEILILCVSLPHLCPKPTGAPQAFRIHGNCQHSGEEAFCIAGKCASQSQI